MKIYHFKPKRQKNSLFIKVLIAVGIVQAALLLLLGGIMVTQTIFPKEQVFEGAPPPPPNTEPQKQRKKVMVKNVQKRSNQVVKRINIPPIQKMATPEVTISLPSGLGGEDSGGMGAVNISGMSNLEKLKIEVPTMSIFDTKASSDRVFIAFEATPHTMRDDMGGLEAYNVVKDEIKKLVSMLPSTSLMNVMAFDTNNQTTMDFCFPSLVVASPENKERFARWIDTINPDLEKVGLWGRNNYTLKYPIPPAATGREDFKFHYDGFQHHGVVGYYKFYQAAIEQGAGAVWILTTKWPAPNEYFLPYSEEQIKKFNDTWKKNVERERSKGTVVGEQKEWEDWVRAIQPAKDKAKAWLDKENERRRKKGIGQKVVTDLLPLAIELGYDIPKKPLMIGDLRPQTEFKRYTRAKLQACYEPILKKVYDDRGLARPKVNMIMLLDRKTEWNSKKNSNVRAWARWNNDGTSRVLRGAKPVSEYSGD